MHKVDPLAAGVVVATVFAPIFGVARRYAQIDWRAVNRHPFDYFRLTIDYWWLRKAADVESAIEAGMADVDRDANVLGKCRGGNGGKDYRRCNHKMFHVESPAGGSGLVYEDLRRWLSCRCVL
jgi:hypothetical protein